MTQGWGSARGPAGTSRVFSGPLGRPHLGKGDDRAQPVRLEQGGMRT